jgi:hypothetical protein
MPDITMCTGGDCQKKETCYRFTAKPEQWQAYFSGTPRDGEQCGYYWPTQTLQSADTSTVSLP